jgi:hypothetical protein
MPLFDFEKRGVEGGMHLDHCFLMSFVRAFLLQGITRVEENLERTAEVSLSEVDSMNRLVKRLTLALSIVALGWLAAPSHAQNPNPVGVKSVAVKGRFVRVEGNDRFIIRSTDNKDVILWTTPTTRYVVNGKVVRLADLTPGADLNATYVTRENRYYVDAVQVGDVAAAPADSATVFRGRVTAKTAETIIVKNQTGKEMVFKVNNQATFKQGTKAVALNDIKVGATVEVRFVERDSHAWVQELIIDDVSAGAADEPGEEVKGVIVRFVGQNQVIVKTTDNKEVTVDLVPQTVYKFNDQPARIADFPAGADVRIMYNVRDRRPIARSILGIRRP